jgi:hypothetical protein
MMRFSIGFSELAAEAGVNTGSGEECEQHGNEDQIVHRFSAMNCFVITT